MTLRSPEVVGIPSLLPERRLVALSGKLWRGPGFGDYVGEEEYQT